MIDPSGDHTGSRPTVLVSRTGAPPETGILNKPSPLPSLPPVTIHCPSGDQSVDPSTSIADPIPVVSAPSDVINCNRLLPAWLVTIAIRRPSGEMAGGATMPPCGACQI